MIRTSVAAAAGVVIALCTAAPASAGPPVDAEHYSFTESHIEQEEHEDFCPDVPFLVLFEAEGRGYAAGTVRGDGYLYFADRFRSTETYTNVENDRALTIEVVGHFKDQRFEDNGDGTVTITGQLASRTFVYAPDGERLFRDVGLQRFQFVIDLSGTPLDPSDDVFVEDLGQTHQAGLFETEDRGFCEDLVTFLG